MSLEFSLAVLAGSFALAGVLGGSLLTALLSRFAETRRAKLEDERRWLTDRRAVYARYLGLCASMHHEIDTFAIFLPSSAEATVTDEDEGYIKRGAMDYWEKWENELQPLLGEVALIASPNVVDLADRVSGALGELTVPVERREAFDEYYPMWFQTRDLIQVLRDSMRAELVLPELGDLITVGMRDESGWPWLDRRPTRDSYFQGTRD